MCSDYLETIYSFSTVFDDWLWVLAFTALLIGVLRWWKTLQVWMPISFRPFRSLGLGLLWFTIIGLLRIVIYDLIPAICYSGLSGV